MLSSPDHNPGENKEVGEAKAGGIVEWEMKRGRGERDREIGKYGKGEMEGERKLNEERREDRERKLVRIGRESVCGERENIF